LADERRMWVFSKENKIGRDEKDRIFLWFLYLVARVLYERGEALTSWIWGHTCDRPTALLFVVGRQKKVYLVVTLQLIA
jgi:hypothetical protein